MALWPRYYLPVLRDTLSFRDRYDNLFRDFWGPTFSNRPQELSQWNDQLGRLLKDTWDLAPVQNAKNSFRSVHALEFTDPRQCFIRDPQGKPKFQVHFNVKNYKPEEISVSTQGNQLLVSAKHEQKDDEMTVYREFNRRFDLPPNVLPESVTSTLSNDGVLSISAPVQMPAVEACAAERQAASPDIQSPGGGQQQNAVIAKDPTALATPQRRPSAYFAFQLPVRGFRPEEIKVETKDRTVCISGTHETMGEGHESRVSFRREYLLPPNADKDKLNVYVKDGRRLIVEAPIATCESPQATSVHVLAVEHR